MKVCSICKIVKELKDFNKKSSSKDGLQTHCRDCNSRETKKHYTNNGDEVRKRVNERRKALRPKIREFIIAKLSNGCVDCSEKDPLVLDFDHLGNKRFSISYMINGSFSIKDLEKEISKCEVRCANCHRRKTAKDFGWWKLQYLGVD